MYYFTSTSFLCIYIDFYISGQTENQNKTLVSPRQIQRTSDNFIEDI